MGRSEAVAQLDALLEAAREGRAGALLVRGEAGIGKSALLQHAVAAAGTDGFRVLDALGVESEARLAFGGLLELLRPALDLLDGLPGAQAAALRRALALEDPGEVDRFLIGAGTLSLLAAASEEEPVLCVVDDAHWVDAASADAILFAARRLEAERVAILLAARDTERAEELGRGLAEMPLAGLEPQAARELLAASGPGALPASVTERLISATRGNPLALIEIPVTLSEAQRAGAAPIEDPVPVGERVERAFLARAGALGPEARTALLLAAASDDDDLATILRAAGPAAAGLEAAEESGLVGVRGERVVFRHPLVRSALYAAATSAERRRAHAALAQALDPVAVDRIAWHRAAAAVGPDEELARELAEAAERAAERGGTAAEARLLARAAALTPDPQARVPRLLLAGRAAHRAGRNEQATALLEAGLALVTDPRLRADLVEVQLYVARANGEASAQYGRCLEEADRVEVVDPLRAANLVYHAWYVTMERFEFEDADTLALRVEALAQRAGEPEAPVLLVARGWQGFVVGGADAAARRGAELELAGDCITEKAADYGEVLVITEQYPLARRLLARALAEQRADRALTDLIRATVAQAHLEQRLGRLAAARVTAHEAIALAEESGGTELWKAWALARLAQVDALLGREADGRAHAEQAIAIAQGAHDLETETYAVEALGRLELCLGRIPQSIVLLERAAASLRGAREAGYMPWAPDLIEAYARAGRPDDAARELKELEARAVTDGRPWVRAAIARCHALLAPEPFDAAFEAALARCGPDVSPHERARVELLHGERLRRAGRRRDARAALELAREDFAGLGAAGWAARAEQELRASGETLRPREAAGIDELTPAELRVALPVAAGATNREVAASLFLSAKTVEVHLGRIYRKLGVRSRTELARRLPSDGPPRGEGADSR